MAKSNKATEGSGARTLGIVWLLISAALAYPVYSFLVSAGFNEALAGIAVFLGVCLLYEIPYRARVKERHAAAMEHNTRWQSRV